MPWLALVSFLIAAMRDATPVRRLIGLDCCAKSVASSCNSKLIFSSGGVGATSGAAAPRGLDTFSNGFHGVSPRVIFSGLYWNRMMLGVNSTMSGINWMKAPVTALLPGGRSDPATDASR